MNARDVKAGPNGIKDSAMPLFPQIALSGLFGNLAEQGVACVQVVSEEMAETLRETCSSNARNASDYGLKVIEIANANTASATDFFARLLASKSVTDVLTLSAAQARKTFDTASAQNKELWELAQKLAAGAGEPIRKHAAKVLHRAN